MKSSLVQRIERARPLLSAPIGLALAALIIAASGYSVGDACAALWTGATGLEGGPAQAANQIGLGPFHLNLFLLAQSLAKTTPLLFNGLAIALALRAGLFNIGAQGQMTVGALAAGVVGAWGRNGSIPPFVHLVLVALAGVMAGALWGAVPGLLKATRGVHEVLSTIMLNYIAIDVATYLVTHGLKDPNDQSPQTAPIAPSAELAPFVMGSNLTIGLLIALLAAVGVTLLIRRTALGYQIRAVGQGAEAARANGISVERTLVLTLALSGALAGLAGAIEVMGVQHRYMQGAAATYGFDGIAVALLGGLNGLGVALSALFFGALSSGGAYMQTQSNVPAAVTVIVQAVIILLVGIRLLFRERSAPIQSSPVDETQETEERPTPEHAPL